MLPDSGPVLPPVCGVLVCNALSPNARPGASMRALRNLLLLALLTALPAASAFAQGGGSPERFSSNEILDAGHRFFGGVSRGLASVVERAFSTWGQPNGYILGQEGGGAFIGGVRYARGRPSTNNAGGARGPWQGPTPRLGVRGASARPPR